ncbi:MAG: hypothetical protein EXS68_02805 [Candidatus Ryanbacteria bacterium]|nr:hypothetical protein [Candidatus Ryanbacteria bacterium]
MKSKKLCSPNGYHDMRVIFARRIHHAQDSEITGLGRLYTSWDEVREQERCLSCEFERTITTRENFRQHHSPPPT